MADFAGEMQTVSCSHIGFETEMPLTYKYHSFPMPIIPIIITSFQSFK